MPVRIAAAALVVVAFALPRPASHEPRSTQQADDPRPGLDSAQVSQMIAGLERSDPVTCDLAVNGLHNGWWSWSREAGIGVFHDVSAEQRIANGRPRNRVTDPRAVPMLAVHLGNGNPCVRRAAALFLGSNEKLAGASEAMRQGLKASTPRVREAAAFALGVRDEGEDTRPLLDALASEKDPAVLAMVAWGLGQIEDPATVAPLLKVLRHDDPGVRASVAYALGQIEDERATEPLLPLFYMEIGRASCRERV